MLYRHAYLFDRARTFDRGTVHHGTVHRGTVRRKKNVSFGEVRLRYHFLRPTVLRQKNPRGLPNCMPLAQSIVYNYNHNRISLKKITYNKKNNLL